MQQTGINPDFDFLEKVEAAGPFNATQCFQCRKCTNGCPVSFEMDLFPDQVIRLALLGQKDEVLRCETIWNCAACETCSTRCPNGVRIAELMDRFKEMAIQEGIPSPMARVTVLHQAFLDNVRFSGRVFEGALLPVYLMRSGKLQGMFESGALRKELSLGWRLFRKGRLSLLPHMIKGKREVDSILRPSS